MPSIPAVTLPFRLAATLVALGLARLVANSGDQADPLDAQKCNTGCQEVFTDCMDRCDGVVTCQEGCKRAVSECVTKCTTAPPDASAAPPPAASAKPPPAKGGKPPAKPAPPLAKPK